MSGERGRQTPCDAKTKGTGDRCTLPLSSDIQITRRGLKEPHGIIETMARDILAARREGITGLVDLTEYGWTPAQVMRHSASAHARANAPAFQLHHLGGVA